MNILGSRWVPSESKGGNLRAVPKNRRYRGWSGKITTVHYTSHKIYCRWIFFYNKGFYVKVQNEAHKVKGHIINQLQKCFTFQIFRNPLSLQLQIHINHVNYSFWSLSFPALLTKKGEITHVKQAFSLHLSIPYISICI